MADKGMWKKQDDEPVAPVEAPVVAKDAAVSLTGEQLIDMVQSLVGQQDRSSERMAEMIPKAIAEANERSRQWWDDREYPGVSNFNPLGDKDHPRTPLNRRIFYLGHLLHTEELLEPEILLLNRLKPGAYRQHDALGQIINPNFKFIVREMDPGVPNSDLQILFPCNTEDERMNIARYDRGRGMVDLLLEMVPEARVEYGLTPVAA